MTTLEESNDHQKNIVLEVPKIPWFFEGLPKFREFSEDKRYWQPTSKPFMKDADRLKPEVVKKNVKFYGREELSYRHKSFNIFANREGELLCKDCVLRSVGAKSFKDLHINIRNIQEDINISDGELIKCKECFNRKKLHYKSELFPNKFGLNPISTTIAKKIKAFYSNIDAYYNEIHDPAKLEVDHRIPRKRLKVDRELVGVHNEILRILGSKEYSVKEMENFREKEKKDKEEVYLYNGIYLYFQLLLGTHNKMKSVDCNECIVDSNNEDIEAITRLEEELEKLDKKNKERPAIEEAIRTIKQKGIGKRALPIGAECFYEGERDFSQDVHCVGCFWYNPYLWKKSFFELIRIKPEDSRWSKTYKSAFFDARDKKFFKELQELKEEEKDPKSILIPQKEEEKK